MSEISPDLVNPADAAQRAAADGTVSAWVAASAGTGKTKVLTDRVLNLLLLGTPPQNILCLTFTKAAAAEMSNRLYDTLSHWAVMGGAELGDAIARLRGQRPKPETQSFARQLFARVLDAPGGMRILTIHAFCQSVLRRFPLEAGVPPNFEVMEERSAEELVADVQNRVLIAAREATGTPIAAAIAEVASRTDEIGFIELMGNLRAVRGDLEGAIDTAGGIEPYLAALNRELGVAPRETRESCLAQLAAETDFDHPALVRAAGKLIDSDKVTDRKRGEKLADWLSATPLERAATWVQYSSAYLTVAGTKTQTLATKAVAEANPDLLPALLAEQERVASARAHLAAIEAAQATAALTRLAYAFLTGYEKEKRARGFLDYDDLILKTRALLQRAEISPWVLFKLDGGIDHILIDEAQDTNPDQWAVVAALAEDFFTGDGAREMRRTIFAVGDAKQSIFSFQRADPRKFLEMREHFAGRIAAAEQQLKNIPLSVSFRSTAPVLDLVDAVFAREEARAGVALDDLPIRHDLSRQGMAGRVELWPVLTPDDAAPEEPWQPEIEQRFAATPRARLAETIAVTIRDWLERGEMLESRGRRLRAGDILILVRSRTAFVRDLVRHLKQEGVPVAGIDRMVLNRQMAVMDLIALGRFLLLPDDDLTLATVLKGPLYSIDEELLFALAHDRGERTLWQRLRESGDDVSRHAAKELGELLATADFVTPHALYARLLGARGARKRLLAVLGPEAEDPLDEFLTQTLIYERSHVPSLEGFLHWLDAAATEVKRDTDAGSRDEVRIMTVHGSKGLQAPVVFLPDTVSVPVRLPNLLRLDSGAILWAPGEASAAAPATAARETAKERRAEEHRRLLYVALTRAADRLYVCGWQGGRSSAETSWHDLVGYAMAGGLGREETIPLPPRVRAFANPGYVHDAPQAAPGKSDAPRGRGAEIETLEELPAFATTPPPPEPTPTRPLAASRPSQSDTPSRSPLALQADETRFQRGILIHRLLQSLPDLPPEAAEAAARRYLARTTHGLPLDEQAEIAGETLRVLRHPEFSALFGPGSRAEVPVVGLVGTEALSGRIDRLAVTDTEVLIVDYKTQRPAPSRAEEVAPAYLAQLAAYRDALELIYPGKTIRTLLLWTDGPVLMEIEAVS